MKVFDRTKGASWGKLGICARMAVVAMVSMAFAFVGCKQHAGGGEPDVPTPAPILKVIEKEVPAEAKEILEGLTQTEKAEVLELPDEDPISCAIIATESEWGRFPTYFYLLYSNGVAEYEDLDNPRLMH